METDSIVFETVHKPFIANYIVGNYDEALNILSQLRDATLSITEAETKENENVKSVNAHKRLRSLMRQRIAFNRTSKICSDSRAILFAYWTDVTRVKDISELFPHRTSLGIIVLLPETLKLIENCAIQHSEYKTVPCTMVLLNDMLMKLGIDVSDAAVPVYYRTPSTHYQKQTIKMGKKSTVPARITIPTNYAVEVMLDSAQTNLTKYLIDEISESIPDGFDTLRNMLSVRFCLDNESFKKAIEQYDRKDKSRYHNDFAKGISTLIGIYNEGQPADHVILWRGWTSTIVQLFSTAQINELRSKMKPSLHKRWVHLHNINGQEDLSVVLSFLI